MNHEKAINCLMEHVTERINGFFDEHYAEEFEDIEELQDAFARYLHKKALEMVQAKL